MTTAQKRKVLQKIVQLEDDIQKLKQVRLELALSGYASASLSSSGGSKAYTRTDISKVTELIQEMLDELTQYRNMLATGKSKTIHTIATVYI